MKRKFSSLALLVAFAGLAGCNDRLSEINAVDGNSLDTAMLERQAIISAEAGEFENAGVTLSDKAAIFSIGWHNFYNPAADELQARSDAFAVAPDETGLNSRRPRAGKDMGTVTLEAGDTVFELLKVELPNGGVFYNLGRRAPGNHRGPMHSDNGEISNAIPFVPGGTYRFVASGSDDFPAIAVNLTAPAAALQITNPAHNGSIAAGDDLELSWSGGTADAGVMISLVPVPSFAPGERQQGRDGRDGRPLPGGGPGHGGKGPGHGNGRHGKAALRIQLDANPGSYTIAAAELEEIFDLPEVEGVLVHVMQMQVAEVSTDAGEVALQIRTGDVVKLTIAQ